MNKIYRIVFNKTLGLFQVVSELAQSSGKSANSLVDQSASINQTLASPFRLSLLRLLTLSALGMVINFGLFSEAQAAECGPTSRTYTYCFVGENNTGVGNWPTFGNWVNTAGEAAKINILDAKAVFLVSGADKRLDLNTAFLNLSNTPGNPTASLVLEKGARMRHAMDKSVIGYTFAGNILVEGEENALSTIELNTLINGSLRQSGKKITLGNYSQITVSDMVGTSSDTHQKVLGDDRGVLLAGQNIFLNSLNNDSLIFKSGHFTFDQLTSANDNTIIDGKATRVMNINKGDAKALNSDGNSGNGTVSITGGNKAYIGQWNIYGGTLQISNFNSLGLLAPSQTGKVVFDIDSSLEESYGLNYDGKNFGILEFSNANANGTEERTDDFVSKNANTLLKFESYSNAGDRRYILSGDISGEGGVYYGSGGGSYGVETIYDLLGDLSYEGDTYLDIKTKLDFKRDDGIKNLKGDFLVATNSTIQFSGDNSFYGDIYYDINNISSELLRNEPDFDYTKMTYIRFGDRQSSEPIVRSNVNMYGYTDKDIMMDVLNSTLTLNSGYAGNNSDLPFDISMLEDQGIKGSYDGVYGAKLLDIYGDGNKKYVSSQANFVLSEFDLENPDDMWQVDALGLDINSSVEEWQAAINQLAKENPDGIGTGSTVVLNQKSIIGAPGINDPLEDEVIFNGQFEPTVKDTSDGGPTSTLTSNQAYGLNSTLIKTGDGRTVIINPNLTITDLSDIELDERFQQQLNVNVEEGTLDWRVDVPYTREENSYNPNVMVVQGNYQTQAGATTAISNAATFLRIQKQYIYFATVEHPEGIYIPGSGDFILAGKDNPGTDYDSSLDGDRATLNIIAGGGERPEIYAEGKVDIRGALLSVTGVASTQDPDTILKSSEIEDTQFTLIHTSDGFIGGDFVADEDDTKDNLKAVFANNNRPAAFVDYLTGGEGRIINCNVDVTTNCLIDADSDLEEVGVKDASVNAQEYVLSSLSLSWDYKGDLPSITGDFTIEPRSESFEVDTVLADRAADDIKRNEDGLFESDYGLWDGKTLTKKGQGLLVLSADNTYTGDTNINAGRLRITRDHNLGASGALNLGNGLTSFGSTLEIAGTEFDTKGGSTRELVLGRNDNNTINVIEEDNTATFKGNITNSVRFDTAKWYLPNGTLVADQSAPPPEAMRALWADVAGNLVDQDAPPKGSILRFERNSGLMKTGKGHLVLAPDATDSDPSNHKVMDYDGDTEVIEGTLTFKGDTSELKGDLYNQGKAIFDQDTDSNFAGNITEKKFRMVADDPIIAANYTFVPTLFKTGAGALTLKGTSDRNWLVEEGGLITEASRFTGDIKLNADTFLTFDQSPNSLTRASNATEYSGIILGDASSTLNVVGDGALRFDSNTESTLGNVVVGDGTSNTTFYIGNNDPASEKALEVQTDFTIKSGSTTELENTNSYLNVGGKFTQEEDSVLNVMLNLDNNSAGKADITANDISLAGSINVLGFARVNGCEDATTAVTECDPDVASRFVKASELAEVNYTLMQSNSAIDISNLELNQAGFVDPSRTHPLDKFLPSYLVYFFSTSDTANTAGKYTFDIDNINLAWNYGDADRANGTFDIVGDSGFEVDVVLKDRSGETFGTDYNWDGATLTKTGTGELKLSAENEYTGDTIIKEGTLTISDNRNLGANTPTSTVVIGDKDSSSNATLKIDTATNTPETINIDRNIELGERNDNTIEITQADDSVVITGEVTGTTDSGLIKSGAGNLTLDGGFNFGGTDTDTVITDGLLTLNFKDADDQIGGDILNAGELVVDVANGVDSTITGNVLGYDDDKGTVEKTGTGNITLEGSNELDWLVKAGGLLTSADSFDGDITLNDNTFLTFLLNENKVGNYQGKLTGAASSTLNLVNPGEIDFYYDNGSTVGNVVVGNGTGTPLDVSILNLKNKSTGTDPNPFEVQGNFTTKSGSITNLIGTDTYLNVRETFTQESGANLGVTLDLNNSNADITAKNVNLGGSLKILGFSRILCEPIDKCIGQYRVLKSTELEGIEYKLIESQNKINGRFDADVSETHPLDLRQGGYLLFNDDFRDDDKSYYIDTFKLAWIHGDENTSTGTFDLADGTGFEVDEVLADRTLPDGQTEFPGTGWDGKTLEKTGGGELILSEENTYTGDTIIDEGTLTVSNDKNLGNNDPGLGNVGDIQLGNSNPDQGNATLNITGNDKFETDREITLGNRDDNTINVDNPDNSATINGPIKGNGSDSGLVKDGDGELILTNGDNSYTGKTEIVDGTLTLTGNDNVLDNSSDIIIDNGGNLNIGEGRDQTLNNLQNGNPAKPGLPPTITIENPGGELTLSNDKDTTFSGSIDGEVDLVIKGKPKNPSDLTEGNGSLTLDGDLTGLEGDTQITEGGTLIIDGSKNPSTGGKNGNITTDITGEGTNDENKLEITNGGTVTGSINDLGEVKIDDSSNWNITDNSTVGTLDLTGGGSAIFTDPKDPNWDGRELVIDNLKNNGDGKIVINTELGGDDSKTDIIILKNDPVGKTIIEVKNKGGKGDLTTSDGIKVVDADSNGVDTDDDSFELEGGRVVVDNIFNYYLKHGKLDGTGEDWFLRSEKNEGYRQEVDLARNFSSISNQLGLLTLGTYHDRVGANTSTMYNKDNQPHTPWLRIFGESGDVNNGSGVDNQLAYGANYDYKIKGIQVGVDLYENTDEDGIRDVAGAYLSYANSDNDLKGAQQQKIADTSLDSTSGGLYFTRSNKEGAYLDVVGQYSRYSSLKGTSYQGQHLSSGGWGALISGEVGYPWQIDENWTLEPQAQLIYQYTKLDSTQDEYSRFTPDADHSFTGRLGARLAHHGTTESGRPIDSFIRFNYWKTFDHDSTMTVSDLDGNNPTAIETKQGSSKLQFGLGITFEPDTNWQIFAGADYNKQIDGGKGDSISGHLGLKFAF